MRLLLLHVKAETNRSNISSNIKKFPSWMKCWTGLPRPVIAFNYKEKVITFTDWQLKRKGFWDWTHIVITCDIVINEIKKNNKLTYLWRDFSKSFFWSTFSFSKVASFPLSAFSLVLKQNIYIKHFLIFKKKNIKDKERNYKLEIISQDINVCLSHKFDNKMYTQKLHV